jgi:hypothetical protein
MGAVDDAKKYLSLRPPMENKTIFALHPDVLVAGLLDEIERLQKQIRYQEHRDGRIGTHDPICYGYGPSHYECALRKIDMLRELLNADNQTIRLYFGELTSNEMRIIRAAFQWVLIRAELKEGE